MARSTHKQEISFTKKELAQFAELAKLQKQLEAVKEAEMQLRKEVFALINKKGEIGKGTNNIALPDGWALKVVAKETTTVEESVLPAVRVKMREAGITEDVFKFKPSLVADKYKALTMEQKAIVNEALITKPASPEVKIIAPKVKETKNEG